MKSNGLLALCLLVCVLAAGAEPRRKSGSSRKTSSHPETRRRNPSNSQGTSHVDPPSLSYPGYPAPAKPKPSAPKQEQSAIGWNTNKDAPIRKETSINNQQSQPANAQPAHSYPQSGGLSGSSGSAGSHGYPAGGGLSGSKDASQGAHAYPAGGGLSGSKDASQGAHAYPSSNGGYSGNVQSPNIQAQNSNPVNNPSNQFNKPPPAYPGNNPPAYPGNNPPAYPGNNPQHSNYPPAYPGNNPPAYSSNNHPNYNNPQQGYNQQPGGYGGYNQHPGGYGGYNQHPGGYGGYQQSGFGGFPGYAPVQGYGNFGGMGGYGYQKKSSFLSGGTFGAILTGLAVWNLVRSGHKTTNNYYYMNNGTSGARPAEAPEEFNDPIVNELHNCTLTIASSEKTDVNLVPCIIVSSFVSDAEKISNLNQTAEISEVNGLSCLIGIIFKNGTESKIKMPCAALANNAPKDNGTLPQPESLQQSPECVAATSDGLYPTAGCANDTPTRPFEVPLGVIPLDGSQTTTTESSTSTTSATSTITTSAPSETTVSTTAAESKNATMDSSTVSSTTPSTTTVSADETTPEPTTTIA